MIFWALNARRACFLLFSVLSTESNKINNLCVLCVSNERSEWAVSYRIKTEVISNRSHSKTTIFRMILMSYKIVENLNRTAVIQFLKLMIKDYSTDLFTALWYGGNSIFQIRRCCFFILNHNYHHVADKTQKRRINIVFVMNQQRRGVNNYKIKIAFYFIYQAFKKGPIYKTEHF